MIVKTLPSIYARSRPPIVGTASTGIAVAIWMISAIIVDRMPTFTRTRIPMIVLLFREEWIIPIVPDPAWAIEGGESP